MNIEWHEASARNYDKGRTAKVDRIVLHVAEGTYSGTLGWFQNPAAGVSAHYTVAEDGRVGQSVSEKNTAWHAGKVPPGEPEMNPRSIGIEHAGKQNPVTPWQPTEAQLNATAELVAGICQRWGIPADRAHIIGHSEVNPARTARANCPGKGWPWDRFMALVQQHLIVHPDIPAPMKVPDVPPAPGERTVRLMHAVTNLPLGSGTLIEGTDKVYLTPETLEALKHI